MEVLQVLVIKLKKERVRRIYIITFKSMKPYIWKILPDILWSPLSTEETEFQQRGSVSPPYSTVDELI